MYQFIKKDSDTTLLKYKDKEFEIKKDVDLQVKLQSITNSARTKMYVSLTKQGITKEDLIITKKENGKTYIDNTNLMALENDFIQIEQYKMFDDISNKYFGMSLENLTKDIGLNKEEQKKFGTELGLALTGENKSPSEEN